MAETLGSLCDKLATVKLKLWHTDDLERLRSLAAQEKQLHDEINEFMSSAISSDNYSRVMSLTNLSHCA